MNVFAEVEARVLAALEALQNEGALPAGLDVSAVAIETPAIPAMAISPATRPWCWQSKPR